MNKKRLLALVLGLMLSFSGYAQSESTAQSESKGNFFFSVGLYNGIFSNGPLSLLSNLKLKKLFAGIASGNYEFTMGPGNIALGMEAGYSSGSKFGGKGNVDFIPFGINAAYVFPLTNFFYAGPRVRIGGLGMLGPDWNNVVFSTGARLEAELRSTDFPLGLFVAGGIDIFPFAPQLATLPVVEAGLRFPRGKLKKSGSTDAAKNKEPAGTNTGGSKENSSGQSVTAAVVPPEPAPVVPPPVVPPPVAVVPPEPAPVVPPLVVPPPVAVAPVEPPPVEPAPVVVIPEEPATIVPQPVEPPPVEPTPVVVAPQEPATIVPPPVEPAPVVVIPEEPATIVPSPVEPSPVVPPPVAPPPVVVVPPPVVPAPVVTQPQLPPIQGISGASQAQNIYLTLEDGRPGVLNSIYFEPETAVLIELYRSVLNAVGRRLAADPGLNLLIRAYTADFGTSESQYAVSSDRAIFSRNYLVTEYGISASRFSSELYGSDRSPKYATEDWQTHRCVELILFRE